MDESDQLGAKTKFRKGMQLAESFIKQVSNTAVWVDQQLQSPDNNFKISDCVGQAAEVSVAVPVGGIGEIIFSARGALQHHPAQAYDKRCSFKRGEKVSIVDAAHNVLYIGELREGKSAKSAGAAKAKPSKPRKRS